MPIIELGRDIFSYTTTCSNFVFLYQSILRYHAKNTHTLVNTHTSAYTHTHMRTHTDTHTDTHRHTHIHTDKHRHTQTCTHTHTHTHTGSNEYSIVAFSKNTTMITRKKVSEKPIVTFTNHSIHTRLLYNMNKPVWSHVLALSALSTIPDCIRYIIGVFCYNFKSQTNILASY